jgi:hypothetical protein
VSTLSGDGNFTTTRGLGTVSIDGQPHCDERPGRDSSIGYSFFVTYVDTLKTIYTYIHRMHDDITVDRMDVVCSSLISLHIHTERFVIRTQIAKNKKRNGKRLLFCAKFHSGENFLYGTASIDTPHTELILHETHGHTYDQSLIYEIYLNDDTLHEFTCAWRYIFRTLVTIVSGPRNCSALIMDYTQQYHFGRLWRKQVAATKIARAWRKVVDKRLLRLMFREWVHKH